MTIIFFYTTLTEEQQTTLRSGLEWLEEAIQTHAAAFKKNLASKRGPPSNEKTKNKRKAARVVKAAKTPVGEAGPLGF